MRLIAHTTALDGRRYDHMRVPPTPQTGTDTMKTYYVYILASRRNGTLYIGMTNDLPRRVDEHRNHRIEGFTARYHVHRLVYFEEGNDVRAVIAREKQLKKWKRQWKIDLIERDNPEWRDLYDDLLPSTSSEASK